MDNYGLVRHFWPAKVIPWLQKFSLVEAGQCSIVCIWDVASRVRTSAHCASALGASESKLIIPLGIMPLFPEKGRDSPTALYRIRHSEAQNPFWVPSFIVSYIVWPSWSIKILPDQSHAWSSHWSCYEAGNLGIPVLEMPRIVPIQMVTTLWLLKPEDKKEELLQRQGGNAGMGHDVGKLLSPPDHFALSPSLSFNPIATDF